MTKDQKDKFNECFKNITKHDNRKFMNRKDGAGQDIVLSMKDIIDTFKPFIEYTENNKEEKNK